MIKINVSKQNMSSSLDYVSNKNVCIVNLIELNCRTIYSTMSNYSCDRKTEPPQAAVHDCHYLIQKIHDTHSAPNN